MKSSRQDLIPSLEASLCRHFGKPAPISSLRCQPFPRASSYSLLLMDISLQDGTSMSLLMKELSGPSMLPSASFVKPRFLINPEREIEAYRILAPEALGTPLCYGWESPPQSPVHRLFLEFVKGRELYEVGEFELWEETAVWLARFHQRFAGSPPPGERLLHRDGGWCRRWFKRSSKALNQSPHFSAADRSAFNRLARDSERIVRRLASLPCTFIHGEFYPSNVLIRSAAGPGRICALDWEMAGWGSGLIDLAALMSGGWRPSQRRRLAQAYCSAGSGQTVAWKRFWEDLQHCRLHNAVQWLGWSRDWTPPPEHRQDWLSEALQAYEAIRRSREQAAGSREE